MGQKVLTRAALLLALALLFQSLRLFIPLPGIFSAFLIGTLVNMVLLIAAETAGRWPAILISLVAPTAAYLQAMLPLPVFVFPVALANILLVTSFLWLLPQNRGLAIGIAALIKTGVLYGGFYWLLSAISIPPAIATGILFVMSWPQLITAVGGGLLAAAVVQRVK